METMKIVLQFLLDLKYEEIQEIGIRILAQTKDLLLAKFNSLSRHLTLINHN